MPKKKLYFLLQGKFLFFCLFISNFAQAQVIPDETLPQNSAVNSDCTKSCQIEGGTTRDSNLFHSFDQFSIPPDAEAVFNHSPQIRNIFTRVTGNLSSNIEGTISTRINGDIGNQGVANLFLINPNGIMFGANARLNIGGSFLATTADSIFFEDNSQFSTSNSQNSPLLTVSVPIGLQFGENSGEIVNQSQLRKDPDPLFPFFPGSTVGIKVNNGKTIALVGTGIILNNGFLTAFEGRVEIGSVATNSFVALTQNTEGFILSYDSVNQFEEISIIQSQINTGTDFQPRSANSPSGNIQIYGDIVKLLNKSAISSFNRSKFDGGNIIINAEIFSVQDSIVNTTTSRDGNAGNIDIKASLIDLMDLIEDDRVSGFFSQTDNASGNAGNLSIDTDQLTIKNGARISVTTFGLGEGGTLTVDASESIELLGRSADGKFPSGLLSQSEGGKATGNAGDLQITTGKLIVRDGATISVGAIENNNNSTRLGISEGNGGKLTINATESIEVSGFGFDEQGEIARSTLLSESQGMGNAGNLEITTPKLTVTNQGEVNVSATGTGEAGSLNINAQDITLDRGTLTAETKVGDQGNINISNAETLLLRNNSKIITDATTEATGGKITITADAIAGLENSDITANAQQGKGGQITINASRGVIGLEVREQQNPNTSDITAFSELAPEFNGEIIFNTPDIDPLNGLIELPTVPLDAEAIFAQNLCKFEDGKIAKGSSFIITGKGGITPTSKNPLGDRDRVVNWANRDDLKVSQDGVVGVIQRTTQETLETSDRIIQQAQGWVVTADGSVWLTADNPQATLQNSGMVHPDCRKSLVQ